MNIQQLIESKYPTSELPDYNRGEEWTFNGFDLITKEYDFIGSKVKRGQFFLYEHIEWKSDRKSGSYAVLHYPRVAIYLNDRLLDMAFVIDFYNVRRSWENNREYEFTYTDNNGNEQTYTDWPSQRQTEIESIIIWDDSVNVYGHWDGLPVWKELRKAYQKTIWFHRSKEDNRDFLLGSILK
jgi:hypothetical protein